jgi:hypothetical protein
MPHHEPTPTRRRTAVREPSDSWAFTNGFLFALGASFGLMLLLQSFTTLGR